MLVYIIRNLLNGKVYIGQTSLTLEQRWKEHLRYVRDGSGWYFHNAVRKYGEDKFSREVLYRAKTKKELFAMETFFIVLHQSHKPENGYNLTLGGDGTLGYKQPEAVKAKHRLFRHTPESRRKISETQKGKKLSAEHRRKISILQTGKKRGPHSAATKQKMSAAALGRVFSPEHKAKLSAWQTGIKRGAPSEAHRQAIREGKLKSWARIKAARLLSKSPLLSPAEQAP